MCSWTKLRDFAATTEPWEQMSFILDLTGFGSYPKDRTRSIDEILIEAYVCCIIILSCRQNTDAYRGGKFNNWGSHESQNTSEACSLQILCS